MKSFKEVLHSQFGNPSEIPGRLVGWLMSRKNRYRIRYAVEVMKVQPDQLIQFEFQEAIGPSEIDRLFIHHGEHAGRLEIRPYPERKMIYQLLGRQIGLKEPQIIVFPPG